MKISDYLSYIGRVLGGVKQLSQKNGNSTLYLLFDYFCSVIRNGTLIRQYIIGEFWRKSTIEQRRCLTYPRMCKLMNKFNENSKIHYLNEKIDFNKYFKDFVHRDWIYIKDISENHFIAFAKKHKTIIIKPINGVEGEGIRKVNLENASNDSIKNLFHQLSKENVIIEECIVQHPKMIFGNTSVNTIRTMTVLGKDGKGHVVKAILRAGVGDSVVDNYCQGGSIYEVDVKTGIVCSYGKSKAGQLHIYHPETNIIMLGYQIPFWNKVIEISEKAAEHLSEVRIIGWDVAITQDDVQLIEGNHNPDYELYEFIGSTGYYEKFKQLLY